MMTSAAEALARDASSPVSFTQGYPASTTSKLSIRPKIAARSSVSRAVLIAAVLLGAFILVVNIGGFLLTFDVNQKSEGATSRVDASVLQRVRGSIQAYLSNRKLQSSHRISRLGLINEEHAIFDTALREREKLVTESSGTSNNRIEKQELLANKGNTSAVAYKRVQGGFGRLCNQLVILSAALSRAKTEGFVLVIQFNEFPVLRKIDLDLFEKAFHGLFIFRGGKYPENESIQASDTLVSAPTYWCGLKTRLESIRKGIRPKQAYIDAAEKKISEFRSKLPPNSDLMSVHIRNYDGLCENLLPDACEWSSGYEFKPKPYGCNQTLTAGYLQSIKDDFPEHDWTRRRLGVYLSTDRQVEAVDLSWRNHHKELGIEAVFEPDDVQSKKVKNEYTFTSELFVDLWISTLTDFYVAMPRSSCEKIIAEWRGEIHASDKEGKSDRVSPRSCFRNYYPSTSKGLSLASSSSIVVGREWMKKETCPHVKFLALDTKSLPSPMNSSVCVLCEFLLSLSVAMSKARRQGREALHVYGEWGSFVRDVLDIEKMRASSGVAYVQFRDTDEWVLFDRMQIYNSGKLRGSAVRMANQAKCGRGKVLEHLKALGVVPNEKIQREAEELAQQDGDLKASTHSLLESPCPSSSTLHNAFGYCFNDGDPTSCEPEASSFHSRQAKPATMDSSKIGVNVDPVEMMKTLWAIALADDPTMFSQVDPYSPCMQVLALWRIGLGKSLGTGSQSCCLDRYKTSPEPKELSAVQEEGTPTWTCP